tara:strand:- start:1190 stop:1291 length:102 start_codon:yes stop_codon:yes gene_type:complete
MPATGIALSAFIMAVVVLLGGGLLELRNLKNNK